MTRTQPCVGDDMLARLIALREQLTPRGIRYAQLAPVAHLPNEILLDIFRHGAGIAPSTKRTLPFELAVSGVCRVWRHLALSCPEFWTSVFITSKTPPDHLSTYIGRSSDHLLTVTFCHWPSIKRDRIHLSSEAFLPHILNILYSNAWQLRSLRAWNVSDSALLTILSELIDVSAPALTDVSIKGNPTIHDAFYRNHDRFDFPFLIDDSAPSLTSLEIDHFPIETGPMPLGWSFSLRSLKSLTIRTDDLYGFRKANQVAFPLLIAAEDLRLLLQSANALEYLALYGPVVDCGDEENDSISAPVLRTLIIHCETPYVGYRYSLLNTLHAPLLDHLEILWHDDLSYQVWEGDDPTDYLFGSQGEPKFPLVKRLRLHDSTAEGQLHATSFIRAFPNVEELVIGEADVVHISSVLLSLVIPNSNTKNGTLAPGTWPRVKTVLLDGITLKSWKRCAGPLRRWMRAGGHEGAFVMMLNFCPGEIVDRAPTGCKTADVNADVLRILQMGSCVDSACKLATEKRIWYFY